jgi:hypothetical protein
MTESTSCEAMPLQRSVGSSGEMLMFQTHRRPMPNFGAASERSWRRILSLSLVWIMRRGIRQPDGGSGDRSGEIDA